jgi:hypothetical protein
MLFAVKIRQIKRRRGSAIPRLERLRASRPASEQSGEQTPPTDHTAAITGNAVRT